jgi:hypothetical protein
VESRFDEVGTAEVLAPSRRSTHISRSTDEFPVEAKKSLLARRVWRMTPEAPAGQLVDFDPTETSPPVPDTPPRILDPAPVVDWRGSSFDLLNGVEVVDHTDSIPGELFDRLFKR